MPLSAIAARKARREALEAASGVSPSGGTLASPAPAPAAAAAAAAFAEAVAQDQADEVDLVVDLTSDVEDDDGLSNAEEEAQEVAPASSRLAPANRKRANGYGAAADSSKPSARYYVVQSSPATSTPGSTRGSRRTDSRMLKPSDPGSAQVSGDEGGQADDGARADDLLFGFGLPAGEEGATPGRPRKKRRVDTSDAHARRISNFTPRQGETVVLLSEEQVQRLIEGFSKHLKGKGKAQTSPSESGDDEPGVPRIKPERAVVFSLGSDEDLIISGMCTLTPLQGRLSVFSTHLQPDGSTHLLFAPLTHPLPVLRSAASPGDEGQSASQSLALEAAALFALLDLSKELLAPGRTVVLVQSADTGLERMDDALVGMGRVWPAAAGSFGIRGFCPILENHDRPVYPHETPSSWRAALNGLPATCAPSTTIDGMDDVSHASMPYIGLVRGPKRSGKSTFAQEGVNALLNSYEKVAYLDCDLGQSEFSCGGTVELHVISRPLLGPNFSHPAQAVRSYFLGSLSPTLCAEAYLAGIAALMEHYRFEVQYPVGIASKAYAGDGTAGGSGKISEIVPLVVNTQGWVKGLGADLLLDIERMVQPTVVFDFAAEGPSEVDDLEGDWAQPAASALQSKEANITDLSKRIVTLSAIPVTPLLSKYTAAEFRVLSMMSYLHSVAPAQTPSASSTTQQWDFNAALVRRRPWRVDLQVIREIYLAGEGADAVSRDDLPMALNGAVIALAERTQPTSTAEADNDVYETGRPLPPPDETNCIGLAVIHSLSADLKSAHILTPVSPRDLARVSIVIKGELELPVMAMLDWTSGPIDEDQGLLGAAWEEVPFLQLGAADGVGMGRRRYRRNVMRKGQMA